MPKTIESGIFGHHLGFPQKANSTRPHGWFPCIPCSQNIWLDTKTIILQHKWTYSLYPELAAILDAILNFLNSSRMTEVNLADFKRGHSKLLISAKKKLDKKILGSPQKLGLTTGLIEQYLTYIGYACKGG